jgi:hypothetical protein
MLYSRTVASKKMFAFRYRFHFTDAEAAIGPFPEQTNNQKEIL